MSRRQEQVASELRKALQTIIARGLADPRLAGLITVTEVNVSPDLKIATIGVSVLPEERQNRVFHGLRHAAPHLRRQVMDLVGFHNVPVFQFRLDTSLKKQAEVFEALGRVVAEREAKGDQESAPDPEGADPGQSEAGQSEAGRNEAEGREPSR